VETREQRPPSGARGNGGAHGLSERLDQAGKAAGQTWSRARDTFTDLRETVDLPGRVDRHPYGTLAAALGIGYVLGGGLFTALTGRIVGLGLRVGLRLALLPMIKDEIADLAEMMGNQDERAAGEAGAARGESPERT
jgi:hypothetical protein